MTGAFVGDIVGSIYEFDNIKTKNFEDAVRCAVSIGGDSDTVAAITGSVAEAYYGIPEDIRETALSYLDDYLLDTVESLN